MSTAIRSDHASSTAVSPVFDLAEMRSIVRDLFQPSPGIYWTDFLISVTVGYTFAYLCLLTPLFSWQQILGSVVGVLALYRAASFMHEAVHLRQREMTSFRVAWNLLAGIPMLTPSFFYESHLSHHNANHYGTGLDGEYLPLGNGPWKNLWMFLGQVFIHPIAFALRFALLTPVSFLHPRLRQWVLERASSFVINFHFRRIIPPTAPRKLWAAMDIACSLRAWSLLAGPVIAWLCPHPLLETMNWQSLLKLYLISISVLMLNYIRTMVAHRYLSEGEKMTHAGQLLDSIDITGDPIFTELLCPVGLRFHGLHHCFPTIPYHNLGAAHRRLMQRLPPDAAYRKIVYPSFFAAVKDLIARIHDCRRRPDCGANRWYARRTELLREERDPTNEADGPPQEWQERHASLQTEPGRERQTA